MAEDLSQITAGEFSSVPHLLASSEALQIAFIILAIGIISIIIIYKKFSSWVSSQRFYYERPHISRFVHSVMLPVFAIALITAISIHVQTNILTEEVTSSVPAMAENKLNASETFAKILNTFNILVIGYAISHLIPIALTKHERTMQERNDFDVWFDMRGFPDDKGISFTSCTSGSLQKIRQKT